jgi:hypothetical protein
MRKRKPLAHVQLITQSAGVMHSNILIDTIQRLAFDGDASHTSKLKLARR